MRPSWLVVLAAAAGCGTEYMSRSELLHDYPGPPLACDGDPTCARVDALLDGIQGTIGDWCGTVRLQLMNRLAGLGTPAVPSLLRALDGEGWVRPYFAARALQQMGQAPQLSAWCRAHVDHDSFAWACRGDNPWAMLARAGEL